MKALKVILIIVGIIIAAMLIVPLFSPSTATISSEIDIELTPKQVFLGVASYENRDAWDPWLTMDSTAVAKIQPQPEFIGSTYEWSGERLGTGRMHVDKVEEGHYISSSLWFGDVETPSLVEWRFEETAGGTHVVWSFTEETSYPIGRLRMMIGKIFLKKSFDSGLVNLKEYIEANPPVVTGIGEIIIDSFNAANTMVTERPGRMDGVGDIMGEMLGMVMSEVEKQNLIPAGPPFSIYSEWDEEAGTFVVMTGILVEKMGVRSGDVFPKHFEEWTGAVAKYTGPYEDIGPSYMMLEKYIEENNLEITGQAIEIYLNNPMEVNANKLETLIAFPLK